MQNVANIKEYYHSVSQLTNQEADTEMRMFNTLSIKKCCRVNMKTHTKMSIIQKKETK